MVTRLHRDHRKVVGDLQDLLIVGMTQAQRITAGHAHLHLTQGVGRRIGILKKTLEEIFRLFPPQRTETLDREDLTTVQIHLHAFVINLSGVFDNWAWAYLLRHGLVERVGNRRNVGMFIRRTQDLLPATLREYLQSEQIATWHESYLKLYRDTLAHRIPLYIPPAAWTDDDAAKYRTLEEEKIRLIQAADWQKLDEVWAEQDRLGRACHSFLHEAVAGGDSRPMYLHPQVLCDGMTVVEFGNKFYLEWHGHT